MQKGLTKDEIGRAKVKQWFDQWCEKQGRQIPVDWAVDCSAADAENYCKWREAGRRPAEFLWKYLVQRQEELERQGKEFRWRDAIWLKVNQREAVKKVLDHLPGPKLWEAPWRVEQRH